MERNHWITYGQHGNSSMPEDYPAIDRITEKVSAVGNHGFPRRSRFGDDSVHGGSGSEDYAPHIITRMPDLTGYGRETGPQSISLSRPKHGRWVFPAGILKKLPFHKWKYAAAIAIVVAILAWSLFQGSGSHQVAQNTLTDVQRMEDVLKDGTTHRESSTQESGTLQFEGFSGFPPIPTSSTSFNQPMFFNGTDTSRISQNQYLGTPTAPYSSNTASVATSDTPVRDLAPWERQPNPTQSVNTMADTTTMSSQFDFAGNANLPMTVSAGHVMANNVPNTSWPGYNPNVGNSNVSVNPNADNPQWSYNNPQPFTDMPGTTPYYAQQNSYQANNPPQNGQFQPVPPQQTHYQQYPASHDHTIAMNTSNIPSYPQGQGQWPQQNSGNGNYSVPQQHYPGNVPQDSMPNNAQFAPHQQQPYHPLNNVAGSPSTDTYR